MKVLFYFLLLGLALQCISAVPLTRRVDSDLIEVENANEEDIPDEADNEEEAESGSGSGSKRDNIEESTDDDTDSEDVNSVVKDKITSSESDSEEETSEEVGNKEEESEEEKADSKQDELSKKNEVPTSESISDEDGNDQGAPVEDDSGEQAPEEELQEESDPNDTGPPTEDDSAKKRSMLCKRYGGCDSEGEEEHGHHHGHHEHEHEHHHHGHHHGFVHEWGEEEGGGHHGHEGHGHHDHDHHHEHEHEHHHGGHENIGHHGCGHHGGGGFGGYGDGGGGGWGGGGYGGGCGGGWSRSTLPAPPIAFHCRDMVSTDGKKQTQRFCVPIGYYGGHGWPYFHGYPGTGLGQWGWGFPWIKDKIHKSKEGKKKAHEKEAENKVEKTEEKSEKTKSNKKEVRDHITKKQTVHVGYGYASGDNYRLGYQSGGMGGLASTFTGQLGPSTTEEHFKKSVINKRQFRFGGPAGGDVFGGHSTPYGHPVTHPGFTTMGFPGHALASTDVRRSVVRPRRSIYDEDEIPEEILSQANAFDVEDPEQEFAEFQYAGYSPEESNQQNIENVE